MEDILTDPQYFQVIFHTLNQVKQLHQAQADLGLANEAIARKIIDHNARSRFKKATLENNLAYQEVLYKLRSETLDAFNEAKQLEARWKEVEREQREVYQVRHSQHHLMKSLSPLLCFTPS